MVSRNPQHWEHAFSKWTINVVVTLIVYSSPFDHAVSSKWLIKLRQQLQFS